MKPEYQDVFLKAERFVFVCGGPAGCGATVMYDGLELHSGWHEKRDEIWSSWNGAGNE